MKQNIQFTDDNGRVVAEYSAKDEKIYYNINFKGKNSTIEEFLDNYNIKHHQLRNDA